MGIKRKFIGLGLLATLPFVLTSCGSYLFQKTNYSITANGRIDLNQYSYTGDRMLIGGGSVLPVGTAQNKPRNTTGKANIKLNSIFDGGNFSASGSYIDGDVRFNFKGLASNLVGIAYCGVGEGTPDTGGECGTFPTAAFGPIPMAGTNPNKTSPSSRDGGGLTKLKGGDCEQFTTFYESTNSAMPGTGLVIFRVCDAPASNQRTPVGTYTGNDYVTIWIPGDIGINDLNPYANYISGGSMAGEDSSTSISLSFPPTEPTGPAPTIYPSPVAAP